MAKYGIEVREVSKRTVIVDADNLNEALQKVEKAVENEEIVLDYEDYDYRDINASEYWEQGLIPDDEDVSFYFHL